MSGSPRYKVYDADGVYQGNAKEPEAASTMASFYGDGSTIRDGHKKADVVWTEGVDGRAAESYDAVAETVLARIEARTKAYLAGRGW